MKRGHVTGPRAVSFATNALGSFDHVEWLSTDNPRLSSRSVAASHDERRRLLVFTHRRVHPRGRQDLSASGSTGVNWPQPTTLAAGYGAVVTAIAGRSDLDLAPYRSSRRSRR